MQTRIDFYCKHCRLDQTHIAKGRYHPVFDDIWVSQCERCNKKLVRLREHNAKYDPYFRQSPKVKKLARKYRDFLLQPDDPNFNLLYPQVKKQTENYYQNKEIEAWKNQKLAS